MLTVETETTTDVREFEFVDKKFRPSQGVASCRGANDRIKNGEDVPLGVTSC